MKKLQLIILVMLIATVFTACRRGRHTTIVTESNGVSIKIEYAGAILLNDDKTGIEQLSHNAYINYDNNGDKLYVADDHAGHLFYELNGDKTSVLNDHGKTLLTQAIKIIAKHQYNR